jgi:hypothetical protein
VTLRGEDLPVVGADPSLPINACGDFAPGETDRQSAVRWMKRAEAANARCAELERSHAVTIERALEACRQAMRHPGLFTARNLPGILVGIFAPAQAETFLTSEEMGGQDRFRAPAQTAEPEPDPCSCEEALALRALIVTLEAQLAQLIDKQYRAAALLIDANQRGDKLEKRANLWRKVAHIKHRLLHLAEPPRFDSQLERPVRGG